MPILGQEKRADYAGDFVLKSQGVASREGFSHVSQKWYDRTMSFDEGLEKLIKEQGVIQDITSPIREWRCEIDNNKLGFRYLGNDKGMTEDVYFPTERAMTQLANYGNMKGGAAWDLSQDRVNENGDIILKRNRQDAELLCLYFNTHLFNGERTPQDKPRFFRTWNNNHSIRAFLSDRYAVVNNVWFLETLKELIPGGRLSHWRGNADTIWGNILIPDTIRQEKDSDYGGMLSVSNSEVGERRVFTMPSVFRAICMNGCIWDQEKGDGIDRRHLGEIDLVEFRLAIKENLERQIPLLNKGIERILGIRAFGCGDVHVTKCIAEVCQSNKLTKSQSRGVLEGFLEERKVLGKEADTLFGIVGGITRWGQTQDNQVWYNMDCLGGSLTQFSENQWAGLKNRASEMSDNDIEKVYGIAI